MYTMCAREVLHHSSLRRVSCIVLLPRVCRNTKEIPKRQAFVTKKSYYFVNPSSPLTIPTAVLAAVRTNANYMSSLNISEFYFL